MATLRETKDRIGSVRSTLKITSAMKLVASAKLRKAQKAIEGMRPYERTLAEILAAVRTGESSPRADRNYFSDKFAEKPISAPPSTTPTQATGPVFVSESGIGDPETVRKLLEAGFRGFLMGEHFMKNPDPGAALADFIRAI